MITQFFLTLNLSSVCLKSAVPRMLWYVLFILCCKTFPLVSFLNWDCVSALCCKWQLPSASPQQQPHLKQHLFPPDRVANTFKAETVSPSPPKPGWPTSGHQKKLSRVSGPGRVLPRAQGLSYRIIKCPAMPLTWRSSRWGERLPGRTGTGTDRVQSGVPQWRWPAGRRDSWTARGRRSGTRTTRCTGPGTRRSTRTRSERAASSLRGQGRDTTLMKQNKPDGQSSTLASDSQIPTLVPLCRALADVMV